MACRFLVVLLVTSFITTSVDAAAQGDQTIVIRISSNGTPVPALPLFVVDPSSKNLVQIGETASNGEFEFRRNSAEPKWKSASDYFQTETPSYLRMERCSTAGTRNDAVRAILAGRSDSSICAAGCKCEDHQAEELLRPPIRSVFYPRVGPYFVNEDLGHLEPPQEPDQPHWNFDVNFRYAYASVADLDDSAAAVESQLRALSYDTVQSKVDDTATGWGGGAGFTWDIHEAVGIRPGFSLTKYNKWAASVEGSRTNQPNTSSNLAFDTATQFEILQSNLEIGAALKAGAVTFSPGLMVVYVNGNATYTSRLLGAPPGQTPTTEVATGNDQGDFSGWGWGWYARADVALNAHVALGMSYEWTRVDDAITRPSGSFVTLSNVRTSQAVIRISLRP